MVDKAREMPQCEQARDGNMIQRVPADSPVPELLDIKLRNTCMIPRGQKVFDFSPANLARIWGP